MSLATHLITAALSAAIAAGAAWSWRADRCEATTSTAQTTQAQAQTQGATHALTATVSLQQTKDGALVAARARAVAAGAAADRARAESAGLRGDLAAARADLSRAAGAAGGDSCAAIDQLLGAVEEGVGRLSDAGAGIAAEADAHASDARTLMEAWPK